MKIGICTDLHLGYRQYGLEERETDFYQQYNKMIDIFIRNKVDTVIMGGDLFDQPRPSPKALSILTNGLLKLSSENIDVVNIIGNHTMIQSSNFVTADEFIFNNLSNYGNYKLLDHNYFYKKNDVCIFGLPYYFNFNIDTFIAKVNDLNEIAKEQQGLSILVLHQAFKEFCGFSGEKLSIYDIDTSNFDLIICGHIHERKLTDLDDGTIFLQPGSIERLSIAEARDEETNGKGIYIIDTSDNIDLMSVANGFHRIKCERPFLISEMYIDSSDEILSLEKEIMEKVNQYQVSPILFLTVHDTSGSFYQLMDLTKDAKSDYLTVHFNYIDESHTEDTKIDLAQNLGVEKVLKLALNPLGEEEAEFGIDLYRNLKVGNNVSDLLESFREKRRKKRDSEQVVNNEFLEQLKKDELWLDEIQKWIEK